LKKSLLEIKKRKSIEQKRFKKETMAHEKEKTHNEGGQRDGMGGKMTPFCLKFY
jgi:hypothetical protein